MEEMAITLNPGDSIKIRLLDESGVERDYFILGRNEDESNGFFSWAAVVTSKEYSRGSGPRSIGGDTRLDQRKGK